MAALIRRTRLGAFMRHPHQRRTRPPGYRPEHRTTSGPRRRCIRGHECPFHPRYEVGVGAARAVLAATRLMPTIRGGQ